MWHEGLLVATIWLRDVDGPQHGQPNDDEKEEEEQEVQGEGGSVRWSDDEQELHGKYAISMETVALIAAIKSFFFSFLNWESGLQTPLGWQRQQFFILFIFLMNWTSDVWRDPRDSACIKIMGHIWL